MLPIVQLMGKREGLLFTIKFFKERAVGKRSELVATLAPPSPRLPPRSNSAVELRIEHVPDQKSSSSDSDNGTQPPVLNQNLLI